MKQTILGIDASLTSTGWALLVPGWPLRHGAIQVNTRGAQRLEDIEGSVLSIIQYQRPDLVAIEGYAFGAENKAHQIGELGGVLRLALHKRDIPYVEIPPAKAKQFATGKGNAQKDVVMREVLRRWKASFDTSDETEAYVVALMGQAILREQQGAPPEGLTEFQHEIIRAILNPTPKKPKQRKKLAQPAGE